MEPQELSSNWKRLQVQMQRERHHLKPKHTTPGNPAKGISKHRTLRQSKSKRPSSPPNARMDETKSSNSTSKAQNPEKLSESEGLSTQRPADLLNGGLTPAVSPGKYVALDCEMVGIGPRPDSKSMLARASIVDYNGTQLYDSFVVPTEAVTDYRTAVSGITPELVRQGGGARSFQEVQRDIAALLEGRVLVGHAVNNDLSALLLKHPAAMIRDTSELKKYRKLAGGRRPKLRDLAKSILGLDVQMGKHNSVEDARVTMALFRREKGSFEDAKWSFAHARAIQARSSRRPNKPHFRKRNTQQRVN